MALGVALDVVRNAAPAREWGMNSGPERRITSALHTTNLADILERVLDKGIVIAGDITISLAEIELLSIKVRLLIASVDKAQEMGINWWESDPESLIAREAARGRELHAQGTAWPP